MKILLSPAKSLDTNPDSSIAPFSVPTFIDNAEILAKKLQKFSVKEIGKLMHLSENLAELNVERYKNWSKPIEKTEHTHQCGLMFTGEVYKGLDFKSLSLEQMHRAQDQIRILSGLYGMLKPLDLMYPYRLEMGTKWALSSKHKNLYAFWGKELAQYLTKETNEEEVIINLASNEYFKAIDKKALNRRIITPVFKELKGDDYKIVMMYAKHARGAMARYIIENGINQPDDLKGYAIDGYRFHESLSSENEWVFTR